MSMIPKPLENRQLAQHQVMGDLIKKMYTGVDVFAAVAEAFGLSSAQQAQLLDAAAQRPQGDPLEKVFGALGEMMRDQASGARADMLRKYAGLNSLQGMIDAQRPTSCYVK